MTEEFSDHNSEISESYTESIETLTQNSVVQIINNAIAPDYIRPWKTFGNSGSCGSGFCVLVDGLKYVLTNAHCVNGSTLLQIRAYGSPQKYSAKIAFMMISCDLALLTLDDPKIMETLVPLKFNSELPAVLSNVYAIGYPLGLSGGLNLSYNKGTISRIIYTTYCFDGTFENLAIQGTMPINGGISGGPIVDEQAEVRAIAFQQVEGTDNMGEGIPSIVYENFFLRYFRQYGHLFHPERQIKLKEIPSLGVIYQTMENPDLRQYYHMTAPQTGILITTIVPLSGLRDKILPNDILMSFNGTKIENDGTIRLDNNRKIYISHNYLVTNHPPETPANLQVWRQGQVVAIEVTPRYVPQVLETHGYRSAGHYMVIGGLVFMNPSQQYLKQVVREDYPISSYLETLVSCTDLQDLESELVILSALLPNDVNMGYGLIDMSEYPLSTFNGQKVKNLRHLVSLYDHNSQPYIKLEFTNGFDQSHDVIILDSTKVREQQSRILQQNLIPHDRSESLR